MESNTGFEPQKPMSRQKLAAVSAFAAVIATGIFVGAVLPAEYGVDLLGTGEALGLLAISGRGQVESIAPPAAGVHRSSNVAGPPPPTQVPGSQASCVSVARAAGLPLCVPTATPRPSVSARVRTAHMRMFEFLEATPEVIS